jgi:hypothetical protein
VFNTSISTEHKVTQVDTDTTASVSNGHRANEVSFDRTPENSGASPIQARKAKPDPLAELLAPATPKGSSVRLVQAKEVSLSENKHLKDLLS